MKKLIFILLKSVELPIIILLPYHVFMLLESKPEDYHILLRWLLGLMIVICFGLFALAAVVATIGLYKLNIRLAELITKKLKD